MSAVARVYDGVAHTYDADFSKLYERAHKGVIEQLRTFLPAAQGFSGNHPPNLGHALDLAVGTGLFWSRLRGQLAWESLTVNDVSASMLQCARQKLPSCTAFQQGDSLCVPNWVPAGSKDFVTSHFLFSFLSRQAIYDTANHLLRIGGLLSLATTTQQDLKALYTGRFARTGRLLRVERYIKRANTPVTHDALGEELSSYGFEVLARTHLTPRFVLEGFEDVRAWALESGWAASYFERFPRLKLSLATCAFRIAERVMYPLYPIVGNSDMSLYLVRKISA